MEITTASLRTIGPPFTLPRCNLLYEPNPDIGGLWTQIAFGAHSGIFIILAGFITPIVYLYLPKDAERHRSAAGAAGSSTGQTGVTSLPISLCHCLEAVNSVYCAQSITGIAYALLGLIKIRDTDVYHQAFIFCTLITQVGMGTIVMYHENLIHGPEGKGVAPGTERSTVFNTIIRLLPFAPDARKKWNRVHVMDLAYKLCIVISFVTTIVKATRDADFRQCYSGWIVMVVSLMVLNLVSAKFVYLRWKGGSHLHYVFCLIFAVLTTSGAQLWLYKLAKTFRPARIEGGSDESDLTFGQALVLFMLVPLFIDFFSGLILDIKRIQRDSWEGDIGHAEFSSLWTVVLPVVWGGIRSNVGVVARRAFPSWAKNWWELTIKRRWRDSGGIYRWFPWLRRKGKKPVRPGNNNVQGGLGGWRRWGKGKGPENVSGEQLVDSQAEIAGEGNGSEAGPSNTTSIELPIRSIIDPEGQTLSRRGTRTGSIHV
ncbi:hypothetical protein TWF694_005554 [Orbilia ellipsospora]|uniref:Uncharacterized protein n=1 Tax=Orbilia ellipsospora TaxID=2528407 RepID=A0AAV9WTH6_9PEZI